MEGFDFKSLDLFMPGMCRGLRQRNLVVDSGTAISLDPRIRFRFRVHHRHDVLVNESSDGRRN